MYHGTIEKSALSIEKEGFKFRKGKVGAENSITKKLVGDVIYFADTPKATKGFARTEFMVEPSIVEISSSNLNIAGLNDIKKGLSGIEKINYLKAKGFDGLKTGSNDIAIWNIDKIKTKSQLKQLWDKGGKVTTEPTTGVPKVSKRISDETIEKGLVDEFGDLPEIDKKTFKEEAKRIGKVIDEDPEALVRIALGQEDGAKYGIDPSSAFKTVKDQALKNGDVDLLRQLAVDPKAVPTQSKIWGQHIKFLDELGKRKEDAFDKMNKLVKDRKAKFEKRGKSVAKSKKAEVKNIKETIKKPDRYDWNAFISSIRC